MANDEGIDYVIAEPHHRNGILKLIETSVVPFEPISVATGATWEESRGCWEFCVDAAIAQSKSYIAISDKNEVIGFRLTRILDLEELDRNANIYDFMPEGHAKNLHLRLTKDWATILPSKGNLLHFIGLCVHQDYGRRGIALEMTNKNLELGRKLGCVTSAVVASNWMSQRVFEKAGFQKVAVEYYADYKDENGKEIFRIKDPKQKCVKFYVLELIDEQRQ